MDGPISMPDLTFQQTRWIVFLRVLFWTAILNFLCLGGVTCYYGITCPTVASVASGHIYPFFDKIYSRYVYVTQGEQNALSFLFFVGVGCVFACIVIDMVLKRSVTRSASDGSGPD